MAKKKKRKVNKSQEIRKALKAQPHVGPQEMAADLTKRGIKVSAAYVSTVKSSMKGRKKASKKGRTGRKPLIVDQVSVASLVLAKNFAEKVGGIDNAKKLFDALAKIR